MCACRRDEARGTAEIKMKMDKLVTNVYFSEIAVEMEQQMENEHTQEEGEVGR